MYRVTTIAGLGDHGDPQAAAFEAYEAALTRWKMLAAFGFALALWSHYGGGKRRRR